MLGLMAMLWVQDPVKIKKEYWHRATSDTDFQQEVNLLLSYHDKETSWSWSF